MSAPNEPNRRREALLADLATGDDAPEAVAERHGMTLRDLAHWATRAPTIEFMRRVRRLTEERASLAIGRARLGAAHALRRLAEDAEHPETARKACVDLLKLDPAPPPVPPQAGPAPTERDEAGVRRLLDRLDALDADGSAQ